MNKYFVIEVLKHYYLKNSIGFTLMPIIGDINGESLKIRFIRYYTKIFSDIGIDS